MPLWETQTSEVFETSEVYEGGDGGNRTRVRKIRASKIYERSRLKMVTQGASTGADYPEPAAWSFARLAASRAALRVCLARACSWRRSEQVDAVSSVETDCYADRLCSEGHSSI